MLCVFLKLIACRLWVKGCLEWILWMLIVGRVSMKTTYCYHELFNTSMEDPNEEDVWLLVFVLLLSMGAHFKWFVGNGVSI